MKTVLIVEDEKMIRQGIKTMVQRSGVPIDVILDCANGVMALDILKEQKVDLMFTDIRMPKMDGIQLVSEVRKLEHVPEIVAISGFDDFNYAVEMLRNGVREYILKPVERQKITDILVKIENELKEKDKISKAEKQIGIAQIKHLLTGDMSNQEMTLLMEKFGDEFFPDGYRIVVTGKDIESSSPAIVPVYDIKNCNLFIVEKDKYEGLMEEEFCLSYGGASAEHRTLSELRTAYDEAFEARKRAFYLVKPWTEVSEPGPKVPQGLLDQEAKRVESAAWTKRLHLAGTDRTDEMSTDWSTLFEAIKKGHIDFTTFEEGVNRFLLDFHDLYKNAFLEEDEKKIYQLGNLFKYSNVDEYEEALLAFIMDVHGRVNSTTEDSRNEQRIKQALAYIDTHYEQDLNMAVVSNEISMNYSLFSFAFKQYTGKNFVNYLRDIRMNQAKLLLAETDLKVIDISQQVGYDNEKHFMKVFKTQFGVSPSEYRKILSQK